MLDRIYYDRFANEYVKDIENAGIVPPERYLPTYRGSSIYIETWSVGNGLYIEVAYSPFDIAMKRVNAIRHSQEDKHNCTLRHMVSWTIPADKFDEYAERFGFND